MPVDEQYRRQVELLVRVLPFDVRDLLSNEGIDAPLRTAFVVYLISHHRQTWNLSKRERT